LSPIVVSGCKITTIILPVQLIKTKLDLFKESVFSLISCV
jgi:hypothetical protein